MASRADRGHLKPIWENKPIQGKRLIAIGLLSSPPLDVERRGRESFFMSAETAFEYRLALSPT